MSLKKTLRPMAHPEAVEDPEDEIKRRRLSITLEHLRAHGYTPGCRRCELHRQGLHVRAKHTRHDEVCRSRVYRAIRAAKGQASEEENPRLESRAKSSKPVDEPKPVEVPMVASEIPKGESMEISPAVDLELDADIGGRDLHMADMPDSTDF